jgi:protein tyrosine phosphatase (PTP) superfamily phosphohydrolase (DUF442 family)
LDDLQGSTAPPDPSVPAPRSRAVRYIRRSILLFGLVFGLFAGALALRPYVSLNLGVIDPGRAYRSSTPGGWVGDVIREHGLASILNLRGGEADAGWYVREVQGAREAGVDFYDLPLSAVRRPTRRELLLLTDVLAAARPPVLMHCRAGADRTGLATVVYKLYVMGLPPEQAMDGFSLYHGHVALLGTQRLHEPIEEYAAWLKSKGLAHTPDRFRGWVLNDYQAPDPSVEPRPLKPGPRHPV